jgi:serine protease Do
MRSTGSKLFAVLLTVALGAAWGPAVQAETEIRTQDRFKVVVVDDDGERQEEIFEFDQDHPRPFLGVTLIEDERGARVGSVVEGSAAEAAGLQSGDVIVGIDGTTVEEPWDLTRQVLRSEVGQRVDLDVVRDGGSIRLSAELGRREHELDLELHRLGEQMGHLEKHLHNLDVHMRHHHGRPKLGVQLVSATPELREHLGGSPDAGVLVGKVMADMPAEAGGIEVGDLIVAVNGESIADTGDLLRALAEADGQTIEVDLIRDGRNRSFDVVIPPRDED